MVNPRVFISYSQDNDAHKAWVLKLATDLRSHGVDTILDQFDLRLGQDLRFFMEHGLSSSALVLCVCSEKYVEKVNTGTGGAGYEGMIMTQSLLRNANMDYIIPIIKQVKRHLMRLEAKLILISTMIIYIVQNIVSY